MKFSLSRYVMNTVIACLLAGVNASAAVAAPMECSREDAMQAEKEASTLKDWDAVYKSFKRYGHCDDASIAEGYSETVGRLLAKDWDRFGRLVQLTRHSKVFERFVIHHLDETVPSEYLRLIVDNAHTRCAPNAQRLCGLIQRATK